MTARKPAIVTVGNFDGVGFPDVAVTDAGSDTISVLIGNGDGTFSRTVVVPLAAGTRPWAITTYDLNLDSRPDLVVTYSGTNRVTVLLDTCTQ